MKRKKLSLILFLLILTTYLIGQVSLNELKAAYIEKFTRFIEWPAELEQDKEDPFTVGYFEDDEFTEMLITYLSEFKIKGKQIEFKHLHSYQNVYNCDLVYLSKINKQDLRKFLNKVNDMPVLIISHGKGYAKLGTHINFYVENNKLRFEINTKALKKADLSAKYNLLQLAKIVDPKETS